MKKAFITIFLVAVLLVTNVSLVLAKTGKANVEGEIISIDDVNKTITIRTIDLDEITIHFAPEETFGFSQDDAGRFVHVKGEYQEDGSILAYWVKSVDEEVDEDEDGEDKDESAYCSDENEKPHPAAAFLAKLYDKDVSEIMEYHCDGFGFGQIFLALQTEKVTEVAYDEHLVSRTEGEGWGIIWQELGFKGKPKDTDETPTGQDQEIDEEKTPPGQDKEKDEDKTPPGQDKEKKPKKDK